jgi:uncharacterized protein
MLPIATHDQVNLLVVAGLRSWAQDPWQDWLEARFSDARWVRPVEGEWPDLAVWHARIARALDALGNQRDGGSLVLAHGFGALAVVTHALGRGGPVLAGAILLAPADPHRFSIPSGAIDGPMPCPTSLVASTDSPVDSADNAPWLHGDAARRWACIWLARFVDAGAGPGPTGGPAWMLGQRVLEQHVERYGQRHRPAAMQTPWTSMSV